MLTLPRLSYCTYFNLLSEAESDMSKSQPNVRLGFPAYVDIVQYAFFLSFEEAHALPVAGHNYSTLA